jgi:integrase
MSKEQIEAANERLKESGNRITIRTRGNSWLYLRGHLPNKPGEPSGSSQQEIAMHLPFSVDALRRAERDAHLLNQRLIERTFDWKDYGVTEADRLTMPISQLLEEFKAECLKRGKIKPDTWDNTWFYTLKKLPAAASLRESLILAVVHSLEPDSRAREVTCQRLQRLCEFAGLDVDLSEYKGNYEPTPRDIPSDELIVEWRDRIPNEAWRWVYGTIAAFGLRPHEIFTCHFPNPEDPLTLHVHHKTKTGFRVTHAIHPEWAKDWNLAAVNMPQVSRSGREAGQAVCRAFAADRYDIPFQPYDLRHAWAVRASVTKGLPVSTSAAMMGHSVATHTKVYHRWLSAKTNEAVYRRLVLGEG